MKADLDKFESKIEQLLADQANVILEAMDERLSAQSITLLTEMDTRLDKKFDTVITKLDGVMKEVQAHREEDVVGAEQLRRHDDKLENHECRIKTLELQPQQSAI